MGGYAVVDVEIFCTEQDAMNPAIGCTVGEFARVKEGIFVTPGGLAIVDIADLGAVVVTETYLTLAVLAALLEPLPAIAELVSLLRTRC